MSEGNGKIVDEKEEIKPQELKMIITIADGGGISLQAPGNGDAYNEPICLWLLEKAKDHIKGHNMTVAMQKKNEGVVTKSGRFRGLFKK